MKNLFRIHGCVICFFSLVLLYSSANARNPLITHIYAADPLAHIWPDDPNTLWLYTSQDAPGTNHHATMFDYHVFSTTDLVHWTDHGRVFSVDDADWDYYISHNNTWAPSRQNLAGGGFNNYYSFTPASNIRSSIPPIARLHMPERPCRRIMGNCTINPATWCGGSIFPSYKMWVNITLMFPRTTAVHSRLRFARMFTIALKHALRMFYYPRCGIGKKEPYAQPTWTDAHPCLMLDEKYIDPLTGQERDVSGGWHDGDYNKYVDYANGCVHGLLFAYRHNPDVFGDDNDIPESGNGIPDIIDELKWELDCLKKCGIPMARFCSACTFPAPNRHPVRIMCCAISIRPFPKPAALWPVSLRTCMSCSKSFPSWPIMRTTCWKKPISAGTG